MKSKKMIALGTFFPLCLMGKLRKDRALEQTVSAQFLQYQSPDAASARVSWDRICRQLTKDSKYYAV